MQIRRIADDDLPATEAFLKEHAGSSMFLRSNLRAAGLASDGRPYSGVYVGAFDDAGGVLGLIAHGWNGNLLLQAPAHSADLARAAVLESQLEVKGVIGLWDQVESVLDALRLQTAAFKLRSKEILYSLRLQEISIPGLLRSEGTLVRLATIEDLPTLTEWAHDYRVEALGDVPSNELRADAGRAMRQAIEEKRAFVLEDTEGLRAKSLFNAQLPDCVQIGGVWTPRAHRSKGFARSVVAGSLLQARDRGVERALLFTDEENKPAQSAYRALGFSPIGSYGIVLL